MCARLKDTRQDMVLPVRSSVNLFNREYADDRVDLFVKVPGGTVEVKRLYYANQWLWEHTRNNLEFLTDSFSGKVASIVKGGITYKKTSSTPPVYSHDTFRIVSENGTSMK